MVSHCSHISFCLCHRVFVLPLEGLTITGQGLLSAGTKLSLQCFFQTNLNWKNQLNCISCFHLMAVVYLIINRRLTVSFTLFYRVWHFQWSMAVVSRAVLVNAGGRGIRAVFYISKRTRVLAARMDQRSLSWSYHIEVFTLAARIYKEISVRPDS